jgi:hypothetical protein
VVQEFCGWQRSYVFSRSPLGERNWLRSANDMAAFVLSPELNNSAVCVAAAMFAIWVADRHESPSALKVDKVLQRR